MRTCQTLIWVLLLAALGTVPRSSNAHEALIGVSGSGKLKIDLHDVPTPINDTSRQTARVTLSQGLGRTRGGSRFFSVAEKPCAPARQAGQGAGRYLSFG